MKYIMLKTNIKKGHIYKIDNGYFRTDCGEDGLLYDVQGWRVTKQKHNGKDERAYERVVACFFGINAQTKALEYFGKHCA